MVWFAWSGLFNIYLKLDQVFSIFTNKVLNCGPHHVMRPQHLGCGGHRNRNGPWLRTDCGPHRSQYGRIRPQQPQQNCDRNRNLKPCLPWSLLLVFSKLHEVSFGWRNNTGQVLCWKSFGYMILLNKFGCIYDVSEWPLGTIHWN